MSKFIVEDKIFEEFPNLKIGLVVCNSIDNNAIHIVIDLLLPYLKYDPDSEDRVLDLEKEDIEDKHLTLYEEIFVPFIIEATSAILITEMIINSVRIRKILKNREKNAD